MQLFLTIYFPGSGCSLRQGQYGLILCSPYYKPGTTPGISSHFTISTAPLAATTISPMLHTRKPRRGDCYLQKTTQAVGSRICQAVLAL